MLSGAQEAAALRFSTRELPVRERMPMWCEEFGQRMLHVEIEPLPDAPLHVEATLHSLRGLRTLSFTGSSMRLQRTQANLADGDESIGMIVNTSTSAIVSQRGQDTALGSGEGIALLHTEPATVTYARGSHLALVLAREALESRLTDIDDATMRLISRRSEALRLLLVYLRLVREKVGPATPELRDAVATHVYDLVALAVGTHAPLGESSLSAVAAARLAMVLDYIAASFQDPALSVGSVARHLNISPRYLQRLLEMAATSFTERVNELRLQRVIALLTNEADSRRRISDIALEVGFSDVSHFNRLFRARFGDTPGGIRCGAKQRCA